MSKEVSIAGYTYNCFTVVFDNTKDYGLNLSKEDVCVGCKESYRLGYLKRQDLLMAKVPMGSENTNLNFSDFGYADECKINELFF